MKKRALFLILTLILVLPSWLCAQVPAAPRSPEESRVIEVYKRVNEAVVFITTTSINFDIVYGFRPSQGTGSGFIIDAERGIILTNYHVIEEANEVEVALAKGGIFGAKLVGIDPETDLAVLRLVNPPSDLTAVEFGDSSQLEVGQRVLAIGNPYGLERTLTTGVISSLNRTIQKDDGSLLRGLVQTDAPINRGNSGGPLLDTGGRLVGINTAILSQSGDSAGIGFAVAANRIKRILPELVATGKVLRPELGWILVDTTQGPMVERVLPGGPAARAGVVPINRRVRGTLIEGYVQDTSRADLIYSVNKTRVDSKDNVEETISEHKSADPIRFEFRTGGINGPSRIVEIPPILR